MASYNPYSKWQYRNKTYDEDYDSDCDSSCWDNGDYYEDEEEGRKIAIEVLEKHLPRKWSRMDVYDEVKCVPLHTKSSEFHRIVSKIRSSLDVFIYRIERVQNPFLWGSYLLMKGEYKKRLNKFVKEKMLFHATGRDNVSSIVENNFDWRRTVRSKFGKGVSFSPCAEYANDYCNSSAGCHRALIFTRVLVGNCQYGSYKTRIPDYDCDTTIGNGNLVYVKYGDNEYYPEYVAYYNYY